MSDDLDTVKSADEKSAGKRGYHHGALRVELIAAAEAVIAERGVDGFSLRETARRAGVSPAAPQHHFGDARGLLTAVATAGFSGLCEALSAADAGGGSRIERLRAQGAAYVAFALAEPARFDVMWRKARIDGEDAGFRAEAGRAFELLRAAVEDRAPGAPDFDFPADAGVIASWSLVHGFARLALDGAFGIGEGAAEAAAAAMLEGVMARLDV